jgi:hypothetical protein
MKNRRKFSRGIKKQSQGEVVITTPQMHLKKKEEIGIFSWVITV